MESSSKQESRLQRSLGLSNLGTATNRVRRPVNLAAAEKNLESLATMSKLVESPANNPLSNLNLFSDSKEEEEENELSLVEKIQIDRFFQEISSINKNIEFWKDEFDKSSSLALKKSFYNHIKKELDEKQNVINKTKEFYDKIEKKKNRLPLVKNFASKYLNASKEIKEVNEYFERTLKGSTNTFKKEQGIINIGEYESLSASNDPYIQQLQAKAKVIFEEKKRGPLCDSEGFYQHTGECWSDAFQQVILNTDGIKERIQTLFIYYAVPKLDYLPDSAFMSISSTKTPTQYYYEEYASIQDKKKWVSIYLKEVQKRFLRHYISEGKRRNLNEEICGLEQPAEVAREKLRAIARNANARKSGKEAQTTAILGKLGTITDKLKKVGNVIRPLQIKVATEGLNKLSSEEKNSYLKLVTEIKSLEEFKGKTALSLEEYRKQNVYSGGNEEDLSILLNVINNVYFPQQPFYFSRYDNKALKDKGSYPLDKLINDLQTNPDTILNNASALLLGMGIYKYGLHGPRTTGHEAAFYICGGQQFFYEDNTGICPFPWKNFLRSWANIGEESRIEFWSIHLKKGSIDYSNSFYPVIVSNSGTIFSTYIDSKLYEFSSDTYESSRNGVFFKLHRLYDGDKFCILEGVLYISSPLSQAASNTSYKFQPEARIKKHPLIQAILDKNTDEAVKLLNSSNIPKNLVYRTETLGNMPILIMAINQQLDSIVLKLLEKGYNPRITHPKDNTSAFLFAFEKLQGKTFDSFLDKFGALPDEFPLTVYLDNVDKIPDFYPKIQSLFRHGLDINKKYGDLPLLYYAIMNKNIYLLDILLENDADLTTVSGYLSPVYLAIQVDAGIDILNLLIQKAATINTNTNNDDTIPILIFIMLRLRENIDKSPIYEKYIRAVIEKGANVNEGSKSGLTPLHYAVILNNLGIVRMLYEAGANINIRTKDNVTPIYISADVGNIDMVQYLCSKGADPTIKRNPKGNQPAKNAFDIAKTEEIREILKSCSLKKNASNIVMSTGGRKRKTRRARLRQNARKTRSLK